MTEIEIQALALINEVLGEMGSPPAQIFDRVVGFEDEALCRAIERHDAFKQEVSDALVEALKNIDYGRYLAAEAAVRRFIIAKPDPLVEAYLEAFPGTPLPEASDECAKISAALDAHGLEIVEKKPFLAPLNDRGA